MTNEQVWAQSTVMERCEILKSRVEGLEQLRGSLVRFDDAVTEDVARLRRIEEAARRYSDHTAAQPCYGEADQREWNLLRAALGSEPNR